MRFVASNKDSYFYRVNLGDPEAGVAHERLAEETKVGVQSQLLNIPERHPVPRPIDTTRPDSLLGLCSAHGMAESAGLQAPCFWLLFKCDAVGHAKDVSPCEKQTHPSKPKNGLRDAENSQSETFNDSLARSSV